MATFKPDDIVVCTDPADTPLVRGKTYRVIDMDYELGQAPGVVVWGVATIHAAKRFRQASSLEAASHIRGEQENQPNLFREAGTKAVADLADKVQAIIDAEPIQPVVCVPKAPDGNPKTRLGMAKVPLALIPGPALVHMGEAFRDGAVKYGPANWRDEPVTTSTYVNAALRHILSYYDGETNAEDSGVHHLGHALGCLAIILDAEEQGTLNDDRPTAGRTASLIKEKTRALAA